MNVLHGRKSISWAKSVLPLFTGASSETFRKVPDRVQIDTTLNRQNCAQNHAVKGRRPGLNRTAVERPTELRNYITKRIKDNPSEAAEILDIVGTSGWGNFPFLVS